MTDEQDEIAELRAKCEELEEERDRLREAGCEMLHAVRKQFQYAPTMDGKWHGPPSFKRPMEQMTEVLRDD